ncbi:hypothetical protein [Pseudoalteromonas sp. HF66]|uniref:hypothetical protein n=1 Tax=Pseudoalteromonas sp. HF66 TaxID=2721559 RepID=UPI0014315C4A|nr:hypothetical protein [Pseudoalteromonas sp. HF66]NIZ04973.1 hypothetical protein [Pseudoalteromonas sp. HF66]
MFFQDSINYDLMNAFLLNHNLSDMAFKRRITNEESSENIKVCNNLFRDILIIIQDIYASPGPWDSYCEISIKKYGDDFITYLRDFKYLSNELGLNNGFQISDIKKLYLICLSFLIERQFFSPSDLNSDQLANNEKIILVKKNIDDYASAELLDSKFKAEIIETKYMIPVELMKNLYFSKEVQAIKSFEDSTNKIKELDVQSADIEERLNKLKLEHEANIDEKVEKVKELERTLKNQETAFNFVGLYKGFNDLLKKKILESRVLLGALVSMGIIMITPLMYNINSQSVLSPDIASNLFKLIPFISLEILLIYFFRVILQNYKSVKGQILQIELRQTLCQFIQNYAEYSKEIRTTDSHPLEKFENLIFSGIISDSENLPSTFDGMDQITKLLTSLKGK